MDNALIAIQSELKVPKNNYNEFAKFNYRSCEDILEALKPLLLKHGAMLLLTDTIEYIGDSLFLKATASFVCQGLPNVSVSGYAELSEHKGMSSEQATGTASSYARKYALNGLFLIDETGNDPDGAKEEKKDRAPRPSTPSGTVLPWLNKKTKEWDNAVDALKNKGKTFADIEAIYRVSKSDKELLQKEATK